MITRARVEGMMTRHCVSAVSTALTAVEGISRVEIVIGALEIEHDGRATEDRLREAVAVAGYTLRDVQTDRRTLPIQVTPSE
jgi:copper chaperone CopZ